ncbi:MAG: hypothetical protein R2772_06250 [Chitinophagales bacterium]
MKYNLISDMHHWHFFKWKLSSSLVTAVAQHVSPTPINTFTIEAQINTTKQNTLLKLLIS